MPGPGHGGQRRDAFWDEELFLFQPSCKVFDLFGDYLTDILQVGRSAKSCQWVAWLSGKARGPGGLGRRKGEVAGRGRAGQPRRLPVPVLSDSDGVTGRAMRASGRVSRGTGLTVTVVTVFVSIFFFKFCK